MRAVLLALCVATAVRGAEPVFDATEPPPAVYGPLVWLHNGTAKHGFWSTDEAVQALQVRIDKLEAANTYLTDRAAAECTDATNAETKRVLGLHSTTWIIGGAALLVGIAGGFYFGKKL